MYAATRSFIVALAVCGACSVAVAQDAAVTITNAVQMDDYPHLFDLTGRVTLPAELTRSDSFVVIVYTRSGGGGNIQLQMEGRVEDGTRTPRSALLAFDGAKNTADWKVRIWLGTPEAFDPLYDVYALVLKAFDDQGARTLMNLTDNRYRTFNEIVRVVGQEKLRPVAWTEKMVSTKR